MSNIPEQLVVRQHERRACRLPARAWVGPDSAEHVTLSASEGEVNAAGLVEAPCEVIDCSAGGIGLRSATFFPKPCQVTVRVEVGGEQIELSARVQRTTMLDRVPTYYLGVCFTGEGVEHERRVARLLEAARQSGQGQPSPARTGEAPAERGPGGEGAARA